MKCKMCGTESKLALSHKVRNAYEAQYYLCPNCDFMFVNHPTWLDEAYATPINPSDVGYVTRNVFLSRKSLVTFFLMFGKKGLYLDYAAGYGMLTRLMRDYGLNFLWDDPYVTNLFAQGFEYKKDTHGRLDGITCFECFEHLDTPLSDIEKMIAISDSVLFSTRLKPIGSVPDANWVYYGFEHGQHVAFYSEKTLGFIADKYNLNFYTEGDNFHLLTKKKLPRGILKIVNIIVKLQLDAIFRKLLTSKTSSDQMDVIAKGL
jgi:phage pi2 protein 07